jgi:hypothetical protein
VDMIVWCYIYAHTCLYVFVGNGRIKLCNCRYTLYCVLCRYTIYCLLYRYTIYTVYYVDIHYTVYYIDIQYTEIM